MKQGEKILRILITGASGYIGSRLLLLLAEEGHQIVASVRNRKRLAFPPHLKDRIEVALADFLKEESVEALPKEIDAAYYLIHSMGQRAEGFASDEAKSAQNFQKALSKTRCEQIIYLSGLASGDRLSEHMASRRHVEELLRKGSAPLTVLRAGIILGSGSASFEIIRDLVEKLPAMIAPRWVESRCQPIAVDDVLFYLKGALRNPKCLGRCFEIGGPEALSYREMLSKFARVRKLRRLILPVPVLTPRLSSYWLFFVTSTSFSIAQALVDSLKTEAVCSDSSIQQTLPHSCLGYEEAVRRAFVKIEQNPIVSDWEEALAKSGSDRGLLEYLQAPLQGCLKEEIKLPYRDREAALETLWLIGGKRGWYYMNWAWGVRRFLDRLVGGKATLRPKRAHPTELKSGETLDFWRILLADRKGGRLFLYAEMRLPGEAWLEYRIERGTVTQTATFRPKGLLGRLYWYLLVPIHHYIFRGLCRAVAEGIHSKEEPCSG